MARHSTLLLVCLVALVAAVRLGGAASSSSGSTAALQHRGRGARKAFVIRPRARGTPAAAPPTVAPTFPPTVLSFSPPSPQHLQQHQTLSPSPQHQTLSPTFAPPATSPTPTLAPSIPSSSASPTPRQLVPVARISASAARALQLQTFQNQGLHTQGFQNQGPQNQGFQNQGFQNQGFQNQGFQQASRSKATPIPIVNLKFNLRGDGSYSTSSETGDGTVRQEQGQFNGAAMAVKGMYAYRDHNAGPVQVNYVADEFGYQPQGPNIHPAIMKAVAEQVENARSIKSRKGAAGLNGILDEDYDDGSFRPLKGRAVRRVVVRRL